MIKYISMLPITAYLIFIIVNFYKKKGIPKSISESYYWLSKEQKPLFVLALVLTSLTLLLGYVLENEDNNLQIVILFFACLGISYTAAAARFKKDNITKTWHMCGAIGGYILGFIFIIGKYGFDSFWFVMPSAVLLGIIAWVENNKKGKIIHTTFPSEFSSTNYKYESKLIWWAEIIGLLTIYLGVVL